MPPAVFPVHKATPWYRWRLFAKQASPVVLAADKAAIRTLIWKPPAKFVATACMLCCIRPIENIAVPTCDMFLLERLGLQHLADAKNRELARKLGEMP